MSTTTQQAIQTLKAFLIERLQIRHSQGTDDNFALICTQEVDDPAIAGLVKEYYAKHPDIELSVFDEVFLEGQLEKDGEWLGTIVISNSSANKILRQILVKIQNVCS